MPVTVKKIIIGAGAIAGAIAAIYGAAEALSFKLDRPVFESRYETDLKQIAESQDSIGVEVFKMRRTEAKREFYEADSAVQEYESKGVVAPYDLKQKRDDWQEQIQYWQKQIDQIDERKNEQ